MGADRALAVRSGLNPELCACFVIETHNLVADLSALGDYGAPGHSDVVLDAVDVGVLPRAFGVIERDHRGGDRRGFRKRTHDEQIVTVVVAIHVGEYCGHDFCAESSHGSTLAPT